MSCRCAHLKRLKQAGADYKEKSAVYMDYNAAAPLDRRVLALYQNSSLNSWAHPSSPHLAGQKAGEILEQAERTCLSLTDGEFTRLEFTGGSTAALRRIMESTERRVITSCCDHAAVLEQADNPLLIDVDREGKMDLEALRKTLQTHQNALIVYSPVNHETGAVQDCREIGRLAEAAGALIFIDGAQAAVRLMEKEWLPHCHGFCLSAQKLYGLKGHGVLMTCSDFPLKAQPHEGSPDAPGALTMAETMTLYRKEKNRLLEEQALMITEGWEILSKGHYDIVRLSPEDAAAGVLCLALPGLSGKGKTMEDLFYHLNLSGIILSRFSACTGSVNGASAVLKAMGYPADLCESSLRISLGRDNRREHFFKLRKSLDEFYGS